MLFEGRLSALSASPRPDQRAQFNVANGRVLIDMTFVDADGRVLDTDARDCDVHGPVYSASIVRAVSKRDFDAASASADVIPSASRTFTRSDHLLVRVSTPRADGGSSVVAELLNRTGQRVRNLDVVPGSAPIGTAQFGLPLASLPPDDYQIRLTGPTGTTPIVEQFSLR